MTFFIVTFLLQMQFLWKYIDDLVGKGLTWSVIAQLMVYASATFVPLSLPLAVLLAALMTFGNLGENYELTALKAAGISLTRVMKPLIVFMIIMSIGAFFYSNYSLPFFNWKMRALLYDIQQQRPDIKIKDGVYFNGIDNYSIKIGHKDASTSLLHNIRIYDHSQNVGNGNVTVADSGYMKMTDDKRVLILTLFSGESYVEMPENEHRRTPLKSYPFRRDKFSKQIVNIPLEGFDFQRTDEGLFRGNFQMLNLKQLTYATDSMKKDLRTDQMAMKRNIMASSYYKNVFRHKPDTTQLKLLKNNCTYNYKWFYYRMDKMDKMTALNFALNQARNAKSLITAQEQVQKAKAINLRRHEIEWHKKFTLSLACLIFFFIGAPLGAIIRKGGLGMPLVISVLFFVVYYIISMMGEKMVRESVLPAYFGVWLSSLVLLPLGTFLSFKATHDSSILNLDSYTKFFNKQIAVFKWLAFFKNFGK